MRGFYHDGNKLLLELNVTEGGTVSVEIEREINGEVRQNPDAYARFGKEIAEYKASLAPAAVHKPATAPAPKVKTRRK